MILLSAHAAAAGWSLIAHAGVGSGGGFPSSITTPPIDTAGADLLVFVGQDYLQGPPTLSDSKGNPWILGVGINAADSGCYLYFCRGGAVGPGHTVTWTADYGGCQILAFSGSAPSPADQSNSQAAASGGSIASGAITPSQANCLIVSGVSSNSPNVISVDGGLTITDSPPAGAAMGGGAAYLVQTAAASINAGWTVSGNTDYGSTAVIISFKGA